MLAMTESCTPPQTHGVNARRFEVEDFARVVSFSSLSDFAQPTALLDCGRNAQSQVTFAVTSPGASAFSSLSDFAQPTALLDCGRNAQSQVTFAVAVMSSSLPIAPVRTPALQ